MTVRFEGAQLQQYIAQALNWSLKGGTSELENEDRGYTPVLRSMPQNAPGRRAGDFIILPRGLKGEATPHWLIQLEDLKPGARPVGIEVISDVIFGVSKPPAPEPDFDLTPYGGVERGVSRRHAMLRPSQNHLYLIDLGSTNGTRIQGSFLQARIPTVVQNGDVISFGSLFMRIRIVVTAAHFREAFKR